MKIKYLDNGSCHDAKLGENQSERDRPLIRKIVEAGPGDRLPRTVYANWLAEHGEDDESLRQSKWHDSFEWLCDFADNDEEFNRLVRYPDEYYSEEQKTQSTSDYDNGIGMLMYFLEKVLNEARSGGGSESLPFDTPSVSHIPSTVWRDIWTHYEIVTGKSAAIYLAIIPWIRCGC